MVAAYKICSQILDIFVLWQKKKQYLFPIASLISSKGYKNKKL